MAAPLAMVLRTFSLLNSRSRGAGDGSGIPRRPVLISFLGGRLDSYRGAHRVLQRNGFKATMFVTSDAVRRENPKYLMWKELHAMRRSGVWDVEAYGHRGYTRVSYDARGDMAPFYAVRRYTRSDGLESFADYDQRVTEDVFGARNELRGHGFEPRVLAVPFGDYGQLATNDPRVA